MTPPSARVKTLEQVVLWGVTLGALAFAVFWVAVKGWPPLLVVSPWWLPMR